MTDHYSDTNYVSSYAADPVAYQQQVEIPASRGQSFWSWFLVVWIVIIVIGVLIWFIIWSTRTNNNGTNSNALNITGSRFTATSDTSITATWISVGDPADIVTLYVNPTGQPMTFTPAGQPQGTYRSSTPVNSSSKSATVGGLTTGATYDARLVVTNPNLPGQSNTSPHQSGIVVTAPLVVPTKFSMQASGQQGQISYYPSSAPTTAVYNLAGSTNFLFHQDPDGYICTAGAAQTLAANSPCGDNSYVLYSKASTSGLATGEVGIIQKSQLTTSAQQDSAKWRYNNTGNNEWCLASSTTQCMTYDPNSAKFAVNPANGAIGATGANVVTGQTVTITPQGTRWVNQSFSN